MCITMRRPSAVRTTRARRILKQSIDASGEKARPPARYNSATNVKLLRDALVRHPGHSQQHDATANLNARFNTFALVKNSQAIIVGLNWIGLATRMELTS